MDLGHLRSVGKRLTVGRNAGLECLDHLRIADDHGDEGTVLTDRDRLPALVSFELGEREPAGNLQRIFVLGLRVDRADARQRDQYARDDYRVRSSIFHRRSLRRKWGSSGFAVACSTGRIGAPKRLRDSRTNIPRFGSAVTSQPALSAG